MCGAEDEAKKHYRRPSESDARKAGFYLYRSSAAAAFQQMVAIEIHSTQ
jgi:hypothetical protein